MSELSAKRHEWLRRVIGFDVSQFPAMTPVRANSEPAAAPVFQPRLLSITVSPGKAQVYPGENLVLTATGEFEGGTTRRLADDVEWTSSDANIEVNASGVVTVRPVGAHGKIRATDRTSQVFGEAVIMVAAPDVVPVLRAIEITPARVSIRSYPPGGLVPVDTPPQFRATGVFTDGSRQDLTRSVVWSTDRAEVLGVDATGASTPGLVAGTATVTATLNSAKLSATASVAVTLPAAPPAPRKPVRTLTAITVTPAKVAMDPHVHQQFNAAATFSDGTEEDYTNKVEWQSSSPEISMDASGGGFGKGVATANSVSVAEAVVITATDKATGRTGTATATVAPPQTVDLDTPLGKLTVYAEFEAKLRPLLATANGAYNGALKGWHALDKSYQTFLAAKADLPAEDEILETVKANTPPALHSLALINARVDLGVEHLQADVQKAISDAQRAESLFKISDEALHEVNERHEAAGLQADAAKMGRVLHYATMLYVKAEQAMSSEPPNLTAFLDLLPDIVDDSWNALNPLSQQANELIATADRREAWRLKQQLEDARDAVKALSDYIATIKPLAHKAKQLEYEAWHDLEQQFGEHDGFSFQKIDAATALAKRFLADDSAFRETITPAVHQVMQVVLFTKDHTMALAHAKQGHAMLDRMYMEMYGASERASKAFDSVTGMRNALFATLGKARKAMYGH